MARFGPKTAMVLLPPGPIPLPPVRVSESVRNDVPVPVHSMPSVSTRPGPVSFVPPRSPTSIRKGLTVSGTESVTGPNGTGAPVQK